MFDKLIELLANFGKFFLPFTVINQKNEGFIARWGIRQRDIGPGFHWLWPLGVEQAFFLSTATRIAELQAQALVTKDGKQIIAGIIITYRVHDAPKAMLEVFQVFEAAQDCCQATFAQYVLNSPLAELSTDAFTERLTAECRKQGFKYGIEIDKVRIHELALARTIRLIGGGEMTR